MTILKKIEIEKIDMACALFSNQYSLFLGLEKTAPKESDKIKEFRQKQETEFLKLEHLKIFIFINLLALLEQKGLRGGRVYLRYMPLHRNNETRELVEGQAHINYLIPNNIYKNTLAKKYPDISGIIEKCIQCLNTKIIDKRGDFATILYSEKDLKQSNTVVNFNERKLTFLTDIKQLDKIKEQLSKHMQSRLFSFAFNLGLNQDIGKKYLESVAAQIEKEVLDEQLQSSVKAARVSSHKI